MEPGIRVRGLAKHFGEIEAVAGVDLEVPQGAVFGLLGPDGAGKSTLIRMLATVLLPDAGDAEVFGISASSSPDRLTPRIGYMSQRFSMYPDLSVAENLEFFARVRGVSRPRRRERAAELLESMGMAPFAARQARLLSGGMKQKLMLASTLMHEPDLLLLDEPTTGVDPVSRREFWRILAGIHAEGRTVLVATPYMDEAERCSHVGFMDAGRITHSGTPQDLKDAVPGTLLEVTAPDPRAALTVLRDLPGVTQAHLLGNTVRVLMATPTTELGTMAEPGTMADPVEASPPRPFDTLRDRPATPRSTTTAEPGTMAEPVEASPPRPFDTLRDRPATPQPTTMAEPGTMAEPVEAPRPATQGVARALREAGIAADVRPTEMDMETVFACFAEGVGG